MLLQDAKALADDVEYEAAVEAFARVLRAADATPAQRVEALHGIGSSQVAIGDEDKGVQAYLELLAFQPGWTPPANLSPKVLQAFERAKVADAAAAVSLRAELDAATGEVRIHADDPKSRVERVQVRWVGERETGIVDAARDTGGAWSVSPAAGSGTVRLVVQAVNRYGFPVARAGSLDRPIELERRAAVQVTPGPGAPEGAGPGLWRTLALGSGLVGLAALGGGTWFGLDAKAGETRYNDDPLSFQGGHDEALAFGEATQQRADAANILFGVGGALVATGAVLWFLGDGGPGGEEGPELGVLPTRDGVAFMARIPLR